MCGIEEKLGKSRTSWAQRCLGIGFIAGTLVVLLYLIVSQNFANVPYGNESFVFKPPWFLHLCHSVPFGMGYVFSSPLFFLPQIILIFLSLHITHRHNKKRKTTQLMHERPTPSITKF